MKTKLTTIDIAKQAFHFSAAHFTVFSATNRERLHGHNFRLGVAITGEVDENGLCFDYAVYKDLLKEICARYDEFTLIAERSPHLKIEDDGDFHVVTHNNIAVPLLKTDTILLPIRNVTIDEMAHFFLEEVLGDRSLVTELKIHKIELRISSGPDQWGIASWER
jgi:6-pyruvoyltetrahydropterin/6-carboxytetrahydropterin synthase